MFNTKKIKSKTIKKVYLKYKAEVVMVDGSKYETMIFPWVQQDIYRNRKVIKANEFLFQNMLGNGYVYASDNETLLNVSNIVSLRFILLESQTLNIDEDEFCERTYGSPIISDELFEELCKI